MNAGPQADPRPSCTSAIIGQGDVIELVLLSLFVGGNSLIVGVPGLAKTLLIATLAQVRRPEVQPHPVHARPDAVGHHRHRHHSGGSGDRPPVRWCSRPGPIFANIVLADEINRTPPKTQSALLEAMQEHRVTIQGRTYDLDEPFFVFATQNPIELEGTYPLPEAQLDRFMFHIVIEHPPEDEELDVVRDDDGHHRSALRAAGDGRRSGRVPAAGAPGAGRRAGDALRAVAGPHEPARKSKNAPESVKKWVAFGASVRAAQFLVLGGEGARADAAAAITSASRTSGRWRTRCCGTACSRTSAPSPKASRPTQIIDELLSAVATPRSGM